MDTPIFAWHFSDGTLKYDYDGVPIEAGLELSKLEDDLTHETAFHACLNPLDALRWYSIRPNEKLIVSRVQLDGKMVSVTESAIGVPCEMLLAQQRRHLWAADVSHRIDEFAINYIKETLQLLQDMGINIHPSIDHALNTRQQWLAGQSSYSDLQDATDKMKHRLGDLKLTWSQNIKMAVLAITEKDYNDVIDADYTDYILSKIPETAKDNLNASMESVRYVYRGLIEELQIVLKRKPQFFVLEVLSFVHWLRQSIAYYQMWKKAFESLGDILDADVIEHRQQLKQKLDHGVSLDLDIFPSMPEDYQVKLPTPDMELHQMLLTLAPDDYKEDLS